MMGMEVSYLEAESPCCENCRQSCELCSDLMSHWSPNHPETNRIMRHTLEWMHTVILKISKQEGRARELIHLSPVFCTFELILLSLAFPIYFQFLSFPSHFICLPVLILY